MTPEELERLELLRDLIASGGGTNLAGQTATDPTYSSGQRYAQQIAGGVIPNSQVIAPGVSYSPEQAGGYTQKDLDMIAAGPAPVMPIAPTTGDVATIDDQMEFAPVGTTEPTRFSIGDTLFPNVDYLQGLDFSGLPGLGNLDAIIQEYSDRIDAGEPEPFESFLTDFSPAPVMPDAPASSGSFGITPEMIANAVEKQKIETAEPIYDRYAEPIYDRYIEEQIIPSVVPQTVAQVPVMPSFPIQLPMNFTGLPKLDFTGLPQVPVMPEPIIQKPVIPQIPNFQIEQLGLPMNFTGLPNIPVPPAAQVYIPPPPPPPAYTQPRVEDIIAPIRAGSARSFQQPGLFNLA